MQHYIILKCNKKIKKIKTKDIVNVEASGEYSRFHLRNREIELACMTLKSIEKILFKNYFFRISRSNLINLEHCEEILIAGVNKVVLSNKTQLKISNNKMKDLKKVFYDYCKKGILL